MYQFKPFNASSHGMCDWRRGEGTDTKKTLKTRGLCQMTDVMAQEAGLATTFLLSLLEVKVVFVSFTSQMLVTLWRAGQSPGNLPLRWWLGLTQGQQKYCRQSSVWQRGIRAMNQSQGFAVASRCFSGQFILVMTDQTRTYHRTHKVLGRVWIMLLPRRGAFVFPRRC